MNNNQMIKYKESFIFKIKNFFKIIFGKKNETKSYKEKNEVQKTIRDTKDIKNNFVSKLKVDSKVVDRISQKEKFLKDIKGNIERLNQLSNDELRKLEKYYDSIIVENEQKIKKLKAVS